MEHEPGYRYVPFITLSELKPRVWVTLSDCNFKCRGCFSIAREPVGEPMTVEQLLTLVKACLLYTSPSPRDVEESRMPSSA